MKKLIRTSLSVLLGLSLTISLAGNALAQKSGTYTAWFGFHSFGTYTELGKEVQHWHGEFNGAIRNEAGSGFLHDASVICPGATLILAGHAYYSGNCIITDREGDRATLIWSCDAKLGTRCDGPMEWVGGTGKYTGISGKNTFNGGMIGTSAQGYAIWKGEWRLP